jgi:hypothetical protein
MHASDFSSGAVHPCARHGRRLVRSQRMWRRVLNQPATERGERAPAAVAHEALDRSRDDDAGSSLQSSIDALATVALDALTDDAARLAFWCNTYNALLRHALHRLRPTGTVVTNLLLFERAVWWVGGHRFSLNDVEHGVLRKNQRPLPLWPRPFAPSDPRYGLMLSRPEPRIHFALNCGAVSCPPIRAYTPEAVDEQLELATRSYLGSMTKVDRSKGEVTLSRLVSLYAQDFGSRTDAIRFTARHLDGPDAAWLEANADSVRVRFGGYDWSFVT